MNLHLSYVPFLNFGIQIKKIAIPSPLNLLDLDLSVSLTVSLGTFVLFAALLFEDDDLVRLAVTDNGRQYGRVGSDLCIGAAAEDEGRDIYLTSSFAFDRRYTKYLSVFDRELLSACFYDCVTHFLLSPTIGRKTPDSRKAQIILKNGSFVNRRRNYSCHA